MSKTDDFELQLGAKEIDSISAKNNRTNTNTISVNNENDDIIYVEIV